MRTTLYFLLLVLSLSGCTQPEDPQSEQKEEAYVQKFIPPRKDAVARHFIDLIRIGDIEHAQQMAGPPLQGTNVIPTLRFIHGVLSQGKFLDVAPIGYQTNETTYAQEKTLLDAFTYQLHFNGRWYYAEIVLDGASNSNAVLGFHLNWYNRGFASMAAFNRFTFVGRGWRDWTALTLCIVTPIFIIVAAVICAFSPVRRKWLWILFILVGIVQFNYEWTHALVNFHLLSLVLLGSGYHRASIYSPLILQWSIPVGACIFLIRRRKLIEAKIQEDRKPPKMKSSAPPA